MSILVTAILLGLAVSASVVVFYVFPASTTSLVRYRLWPIRDELYDCIVDGQFHDDEQPRNLLRTIETTIAYANEFRPLRMITLVVIAHGKLPPGVDHLEFDLANANEADKAKLESIWQRYMSAVLKHVLTGSWSGLVAAVVVLGAAAIGAILKGRPWGGGNHHDPSVVEDVKRAVRRDIPLDSTLRVLSERPKLKELSASV
jgi:hypothetical protein